MKRHPNIAFFGGTVVIALMVLAAFSNMAMFENAASTIRAITTVPPKKAMFG